MLDETSAELAMDDPRGFRATVEVSHDTSGGELALELGPYARRSGSDLLASDAMSGNRFQNVRR